MTHYTRKSIAWLFLPMSLGLAACMAAVCVTNTLRGCGLRQIYDTCPLAGCGQRLTCLGSSQVVLRDVMQVPRGQSGKDSVRSVGTKTCTWTCEAKCNNHAQPFKWIISSSEDWTEFQAAGNDCIYQ